MDKFELVLEETLMNWKVFGYTLFGLVSLLLVLLTVSPQ